jgi:hypothetical protein
MDGNLATSGEFSAIIKRPAAVAKRVIRTWDFSRSAAFLPTGWLSHLRAEFHGETSPTFGVGSFSGNWKR